MTIQHADHETERAKFLAKYDYMISLRRRDWCWEFLRRNFDFAAMAFDELNAVKRSESCLQGGQNLRLSSPQSNAERWGLLFFPNPDIPAPRADVFWVPERDPFIVPMVVGPRRLDEEDKMYAQIVEAATIHVLRDAFGQEHLLTKGRFATAQSICTGQSILAATETFKLNLHIEGPESAKSALAAYERASAILHEGPWEWTEKTLRLRNALICLDVKEAGLSLRHAAEMIYGKHRVDDTWSEDKSFRDSVRSLYRTGVRLRDRDYLKILRKAPFEINTDLAIQLR
ncbi:MAG: hypothetical protein Hens3KO_20250 [Henriciella sp.]